MQFGLSLARVDGAHRRGEAECRWRRREDRRHWFLSQNAVSRPKFWRELCASPVAHQEFLLKLMPKWLIYALKPAYRGPVER